MRLAPFLSILYVCRFEAKRGDRDVKGQGGGNGPGRFDALDRITLLKLMAERRYSSFEFSFVQ